MADMTTRKNAGFSLIEVITVLVVLSIVSVVFATRLMDTSVELVARTDVVKTHLRYAQSRAMSSSVIWGIDFKGNTYSLFKNGDINGDTSETVTLPGEDSETLSLPSGTSATEIVAFDSWGKPYNDASGATPHPGGQIGALLIVITPNTGFIE